MPAMVHLLPMMRPLYGTAMFDKILVANRGEIAMRILRACGEMDIETVAVYSTADEDSLHVPFADEAYCIGPAKSKDSYLNQQAILTVAKATHCDAIHPGYGFLSENDGFADACEKEGIVFIGPSGDMIRRMGNKASARALMQSVGVPVVPGSDGRVNTLEQAEEIGEAIGYPILIKASAGGGGRGMRRVYTAHTLEAMLREATAESVACFGSDEMYIEKLVLNPRHIEFQIMADDFGNVVQLGERDCSIQRKNQKLLEESPSKGLTKELRKRMGDMAKLAAKTAHYVNAGTIEFVLAPNGEFYFIEMNTRIQVEHPVTELVSGIDLVCEQIRVASGLPLSFTQEEICLNGHAIECRINAENPHLDFRPCPGKAEFVYFPGGPGVRIDTCMYNGYEIPPHYDSMVAKIIVHSSTRMGAIRRMRRALAELTIDPLSTNKELMHQILFHPEFVEGNYDTGFMEAHLETLLEWASCTEEENDI